MKVDLPELQELPPATNALCTLLLARNRGYITFLLSSTHGRAIEGSFTLHKAEATKLAQRLAEMLAGDDGTSDLVEGAYLGGPPEDWQIVKPNRRAE